MLWTFLWRQLANPFGSYSSLFTELDRGHHSGRYQRTVFQHCSCTKIFSSTHRQTLFDLLLHKLFFILAELQFWKTRFDFVYEYFGERTGFWRALNIHDMLFVRVTKSDVSITLVFTSAHELFFFSQYLEAFQRAKAGDAHLQSILMRYSRLIDVRCEKEYWDYLLAKDLVCVFLYLFLWRLTDQPWSSGLACKASLPPNFDWGCLFSIHIPQATSSYDLPACEAVTNDTLQDWGSCSAKWEAPDVSQDHCWHSVWL